MGSYAECWLESLYIGSTKNDFDYGLMQLFRASDKRVHRSAAKDLPRPIHQWANYLEDPKEKIAVVYYTAPAYLIKDRLELKGYTLSTAKRAFMKRMRAEQREYSNEVIEGMEEYYENRANLLKGLDVDQWLATLRHIKEVGLGIPHASPEYKRIVTLEEFMLQTDWYGFPGMDLNVPLRLALETCTAKDNFIYDLTDLVSQEYFDQDEDFVALASEFTAGEYGSRSKIIILTEGRSDGWILAESMKLLYPHLSDYYTFMDFEAARIEGGASQLAKIVKSFAGAGIVNKVIAIFDNDTAGEEAIRSLRQIKLPGNLCVLKLPDFKLLRKYPTIGPSGPRNMNVNGLAASIELYLGDDVLREGGNLTPVHWSAYNPVIGKYQGGVLEKDKIHKRFKEKVARQKNCTNLTQDQNWSGLCAIMCSIFSAFHHFDKKLILAEQLERYARW
jgi:hypothetical protein